MHACSHCFSSLKFQFNTAFYECYCFCLFCLFILFMSSSVISNHYARNTFSASFSLTLPFTRIASENSVFCLLDVLLFWCVFLSLLASQALGIICHFCFVVFAFKGMEDVRKSGATKKLLRLNSTKKNVFCVNM